MRRWIPAVMASMVAMVAITHLVHADSDEPAQLLILIAPILLWAYRGGLAHGLVATVTATTLSYALDPIIDSTADVVRWIAMLAVGGMISVLSENMRRARVRAEAAKHAALRSELRFKTSFHANPQAVAVMTDRFTEVNDAFVELLGWSREELVGAPTTSVPALDVATPARNVATTIVTRAGEPREIMLSIEPFEIDGQPHRLATLVDVTEQKRTEAALRDSEDRLRQTQKMDSLGMLAGGIAHDFNNLLAVISTGATLLRESVTEGSDEAAMLGDIEVTVKRAAGLTRQLLAFSRKQVTAPQVFDLNVGVQDTRKMLARMIGEDIELVTSFEPEQLAVRMDPSQLVQLLVNLVVNARDAMPRGGKLEIRTRRMRNNVQLTVTDTGCGMPAEVRDRVFEPFFTTKAMGRGTGMGLAVVHGVVAGAGGRIELESTPGVGTTFCIYLPFVNEPIGLTEVYEPADVRGTETVLVVDDDDHVRRAASRALAAHGYLVIEAHGGAEALVTLQTTPIDLLLTDVVMPNMDGRELVERMLVEHPQLPYIYMSGYTDDDVVRHGVLRGTCELVEKPFAVLELAAKIRQVLDQRRASAAAA